MICTAGFDENLQAAPSVEAVLPLAQHRGVVHIQAHRKQPVTKTPLGILAEGAAEGLDVSTHFLL